MNKSKYIAIGTTMLIAAVTATVVLTPSLFASSPPQEGVAIEAPVVAAATAEVETVLIPARADAPLVSLKEARESTSACSWDRPGVNRYMGTIEDAINRYKDIPEDVRKQLIFRMDSTDYDETAVITRDAIVGEGAEGYSYEDLREMHFGNNRVCRQVSRAGWKDEHREIGLVYCEGQYCVIVPTVCGNISRVNRIAPLPFDPPGAGPGTFTEGGGATPYSLPPMVLIPPGGKEVAPPETFRTRAFGGPGVDSPPIYVGGGGGGGSTPSAPPTGGVPPVVTPPVVPGDPETPVVPPTNPPVTPPVTPPTDPNPPITPPVDPPILPPVAPPVPEPETYLMMGLGLLAVRYVAKKHGTAKNAG